MRPTGPQSPALCRGSAGPGLDYLDMMRMFGVGPCSSIPIPELFHFSFSRNADFQGPAEPVHATGHIFRDEETNSNPEQGFRTRARELLTWLGTFNQAVAKVSMVEVREISPQFQWLVGAGELCGHMLRGGPRGTVSCRTSVSCCIGHSQIWGRDWVTVEPSAGNGAGL